MSDVRIGVVLPNLTTFSNSAAVGDLARQIESLGFDSLWVAMNDIFPMKSELLTTVYDGRLPSADDSVACPLQVLAIAALQTERIKLGISLPNVPYYSPVGVAGSLCTIDALSRGRVQYGLGLGSSADEFAYVTSQLSRQDTPAAEFIRVMHTIFANGDTSFQGDYYTIPRAKACIAASRRSHPAMHLTAFSPAAVQRPAALLRGGSPIVIPQAAANPLSSLRDVAGQFPDAEVGVRALVQISDEPLGPDRQLFAGSFDQVRSDLRAAVESGATSVLLDLSLTSINGLMADPSILHELLLTFEPVAVAA